VGKEGVGGFGVGVALTSWGGLGGYKSLGKRLRTEAAGQYHSSGTFIANKIERQYGPEYAAGALVGVWLSPTGKGAKRKLQLRFSLDGKSLGAAATLPAAGAAADVRQYLLAVQPYMGGLATIEAASSSAPE